ncbi:hypothetical protein AB395_00004686 (plasmid) [Sinorhizobium fredii CCBAU 45436]|nr:hypothetical protein AB395_00004686 [Sinorhizobium fredii CCBAU 45436]
MSDLLGYARKIAIVAKRDCPISRGAAETLTKVAGVARKIV